MKSIINEFNFHPGRVLANKYEVISKLGNGWEGEVYKVRELNTDIERAAKVFYPNRNLKNKSVIFYAKKLHALRDCPVVIQYYAQETIIYKRLPVTLLISEYVEGDILSEYQKRQRGNRLPVFQAVHLLHALTVGIESIHHMGEYHGDLHSDNVIIRRLGLSFELKLLDFFHWGRATKSNRQEDICNLIRIFYDVIGGKEQYSKHSDEVKYICSGLKRSLILRKFPTASDLRVHLETQAWS
ncbi:MAG: protein kinase [Gammaproteobacteria bacterium]|nr:protein kinase [Gammaproteobacteria bacterium]